MIRNEYGAVQQHLEPNNIKDILIPVPDDWNSVKGIIEYSKETIRIKEDLEKINDLSENEINSFLNDIGI